MIKRILIFVAILLATFLVTYFLHDFVISNNSLIHTYSVLSVYVFHVLATVLIYCLLELAAYYIPSNAGYMYLSGMFIKMGFFLLIFQKDIFGETPLSQPERISMVIPLFIFLVIEVTFIGKLLNSK